MWASTSSVLSLPLQRTLAAPWEAQRGPRLVGRSLFPEEALCQDGGVEGTHWLGVVTQTPQGRDATKLAVGEKALCLVDSVLLFGQQQLLTHVVLKLIL